MTSLIGALVVDIYDLVDKTMIIISS